MRSMIMVILAGSVLLALTPAFAGECGPVGTASPGYWINHPDEWPVEALPVGGVVYTKGAAIVLMKSPVQGDKSLTLFRAFVAAKLNVLSGNCPPDCYPLDEINTWLFNFPVGSGVAANSEAWRYSHGEALYLCLDAYNNGLLPGIPSRDALP